MDPNQPLLKELRLQAAPGTYHHSILIGNLAEAAAEATGENPAPGAGRGRTIMTSEKSGNRNT